MRIQHRSPHLHARILALVVLACALTAAPAHAAPAQTLTPAGKTAAVKLLDEGNRAFSAGDAALALRHFRAAYDRYPSPKIWFNIAEALRALGQLSDAIDSYSRFIDTVGDAVPPARVADARARVSALQAEQARAKPKVTPPVEHETVATGDEHPPTRPTTPPPDRPATPPPVTASPDVRPTPAATTLRTAPTNTARRPESRSVWRSPLVLAGYGVTGALVLALAGTGGATLTYNDRYQDATRSVSDRQSARDTGSRLAWASDGLLIGAIVIALGTTTYAAVKHVRR